MRYYNKNIGGVDRMDQNISYYGLAVRSKKWWMSFVIFIPDLAVQIFGFYIDLPLAMATSLWIS